MKKDLQISTLLHKPPNPISPVNRQVKEFLLSPRRRPDLTLKTQNTQGINTANLKDSPQNSSAELKKFKAAASLKPPLSPLSKDLPLSPSSLIRSDKDKTNISQRRGLTIKFNKLGSPHNEYSQAEIPKPNSSRDLQYELDRSLSHATKTNQSLTSRPDKNIENKPSFLAPTLATLQYLKEVKLRKDNNERGFSFSKPMEPHGDYFPSLMDESKGRGSRADASYAASPTLTNYTKTPSDKSPFLRNHNRQTSKGSSTSVHKTAKYFVWKEQKTEDDIKLPEYEPKSIESKPTGARRISNILTKELEARWGQKLSTSSDESDEESEEEPSIEPIQEEEEKTIEATSPTNAKSPTGKVTFINNKFIMGLKKLGRQATLKRKTQATSEDIIENVYGDGGSPMNSQRLQTMTEFSQTVRGDDLFAENSGGFFQFNESNKLLSTLNDIFDKNGKYKFETKESLNENAPVIVALGSNNTIIQPKYMRQKGSMCVTEFWSQKSNNSFTRHFGRQSKLVTIRLPGRENETVYRPSHWQKEHEIRDRISHESDMRTSPPLNFIRRPEKSRTSIITTNKLQSPSQDRIDLRTAFRNSDKNPPSLLQKMEQAAALINRKNCYSTDNLENSSSRIFLDLDSPKNKSKKDLPQLDIIKLKAFNIPGKIETEKCLSSRLDRSSGLGFGISPSPLLTSRHSEANIKSKAKFIKVQKNRDGSP